ncbi:MAG: hypothetical protein ACREXK_13545 [Gammaproteobacteria bacterium]
MPTFTTSLRTRSTISCRKRSSALQRRNAKLKWAGYLPFRLLFEFPATFLKYYVLQRHFTGGLMGFQSSTIGAYSRFARIARMLEAAQRPDQTAASAEALNERAKAP